MFRTKLMLILALSSLAVGCEVAQRTLAHPLPAKSITLVRSIGIFSDDYMLTNASGKLLTEVRLTMTRLGEGGEKAESTIYWTKWPAGEERAAPLGQNSGRLPNMQRITLVGMTDQGSVNCAFNCPN